MKVWPIQRILVVDDEVEYGKMVQQTLQRMGHSCEVAADAFEALEKLCREQFELVISDIVMKGKDGLELAREARAQYPYLAFIIMTGQAADYSFTDIIDAGASDFIVKPFTNGELKAKIDRVGRERHIVQYLNETNEELQRAYNQLHYALEQTIHVLASALEMRDPYTAGHQTRVAGIASAIAHEMGLSEGMVKAIKLAGLIHDIGKISVPSEILSKPSKLQDAEMSLIMQHTRVGFQILKDIKFPWPIAQIVLQHHERMNGSGYPHGLSGGDILLEARVLAVSDVVEAMSSHRPYRAALGMEKALEELTQNKGTLYDPEVVDTCLKVFIQKGYDLSQGMEDGCNAKPETIVMQ